MSGRTDHKGAGFANELLTIVRQHSFRDPLLDAIRDGQINRDGVKNWALQAALIVRQFTRFISAIHANCPYQDAQQLLAENLWEEHGSGIAGRDHLTLINKLAESLGASREEIELAQPLPETAAYIEHCLRITREGSFTEAMAAIGVAIEYYMPRFFGSLASLLEERFGLSTADVQYLRVHVAADEDHARRSLEIIDKYTNSPDLKERAQRAVRDTLAVKDRFSSAVFQHCMARQ